MVAPDLISEEDIAKLIIPDDLPGEPTFKAYIEAKVYDKEGHLVQHHRQPMRSLTQYFLALMSVVVAGTFQSSSSNRAMAILTTVLGLPSQVSSAGGVNISWDWSIQLGSGTQGFSPTITSLAAPITNGSGAGQLTYGSPTVSYTSTSISVTITVSNYTSSPISVTEIGLTGNIYIQWFSSSTGYGYNKYSSLLSYDTFSSPITVPANGFASFQITISFTG